MRVRIATRGSQLARWQAEYVADLLRRGHTGLEPDLVVVSTHADQRQDIPIWKMGGKGVFVAEVRAALLDGRADVAVHSAKDLPSEPLAGLELAAVPERADSRDVLVGATLADLGPGATVATGSVRRRAQLAWLRPDLTFTGLRGNIATRLGRAGTDGIDAVVGAAAALERLGMADVADEILDPSVMLPQVGQGALAVEVAPGAHRDVLEAVRGLQHEPSRRRVDAERAFLAELGGDCDLPAGAHATDAADGELSLAGMLSSLDGHVLLRRSARGRDPVELGSRLGRELLEAGGAGLLG